MRAHGTQGYQLLQTLRNEPSRGDTQHLLQMGVSQTDPTVELEQIMEVLLETADMRG